MLVVSRTGQMVMQTWTERDWQSTVYKKKTLVACNSYVASTFTLKSNSFTVYGFTRNMTGYVEIAYFYIYTFQIIIIIKLYCHIQHTLYDELECSLALTHIVPIYTIKWNMAN